MSRLICVDASFVLKLVLDEADSEQVHALWAAWAAEGATIIAPCHLAFEVTSVIRNHVCRRNISAEAGQMSFEAFLAQEIELHHPGDLEVRAWELAGQYNRPTAYDTSYLALAENAGCELWTADGRLVKAVAASLPWVKTPLNPGSAGRPGGPTESAAGSHSSQGSAGLAAETGSGGPQEASEAVS